MYRNPKGETIMKRLICIILSALTVCAAFSAVPCAAKGKAVSLKKSSATLAVSKTTKIRLKKKKGVKITSVRYKSSKKSVAAVSKKGKITAKKAGSAKISVKVRYTLKGKKSSAKLRFSVKVKKPAKGFKTRLSAFCNKLYNMTSENESGNYSMSPISVYMALSMLYSIGDAGVKNDVKALTGMKDSDFSRTKELFDKLNRESAFGDKTVSKLSLTNSIWLDSDEEFDQGEVEKLKKELACDSKTVPFRSDNADANKQIRNFIKEKTNGLIDRDFSLDNETLLALINTLYFKDNWDNERESLDTEKREFTSPEGKKKREFIIGKYIQGKAQSNSVCDYYYSQTSCGYKMKFILPKDGHTLKEAMSAQNLNEVNSKKKFGGADRNGTEHFTRCIFPSFKLESDTPLNDIFAKNNALQNAFINFSTPLTKTDLCVSDMKHNVVLDVSKKGIEGAAVTIFAAKASSALRTKPIEYHDLVMNKSFGFIITDPSDVILFEGQVVR